MNRRGRDRVDCRCIGGAGGGSHGGGGDGCGGGGGDGGDSGGGDGDGGVGGGGGGGVGDGNLSGGCGGQLHGDSGSGHRGARVQACCRNALCGFGGVAAARNLQGVRGGRIVIIVHVIASGRGRRVPSGHLFGHVDRVVGRHCGRLAALERGRVRRRNGYNDDDGGDDDDGRGAGGGRRRLRTVQIIGSAAVAPRVRRHGETVRDRVRYVIVYNNI